MITRNFKYLLAAALPSASTTGVRIGTLPVRSVNGITYYLCNHVYHFPFGVSFSISRSATSTGISVGTGGTPPTEFDYNLENTLLEGIDLTLTQAVSGMDGDSSYVDLHLTVVNTSDAPITIREIGYKQAALTTERPLATATIDTVILIDRTVLDTPLVLQPNDAGVIEYKLQTNPMGPKYKEGIKLVSWTYGTDEEIVTLINAARQGIVNLQTDAGWSVSDVRIINVNAWTDSLGTQHAANQIAIAISQFGDYNSCGCLFQYDFVGCYDKIPMGEATNGYGGSDGKLYSIPAFFQALPLWLQSVSKEFNVLATKGGSGYPEIETITGNKLALRSRDEVFSEYGTAEGTLVDLYKNQSFRVKYLLDNTNTPWWLRTVWSGRGWYSINENGSLLNSVAFPGGVTGFSPFGCI